MKMQMRNLAPASTAKAGSMAMVFLCFILASKLSWPENGKQIYRLLTRRRWEKPDPTVKVTIKATSASTRPMHGHMRIAPLAQCIDEVHAKEIQASFKCIEITICAQNNVFYLVWCDILFFLTHTILFLFLILIIYRPLNYLITLSQNIIINVWGLYIAVEFHFWFEW